jgi:membrane associated rhomboid family serine protease
MIPIRDQLPTRRAPVVTWILIASNVLVFLLQRSMENAGFTRISLDFGFVPTRFLQDPIREFLTIFSAMFMHGGWLHLLFNMWFLWIFGDNVEDRLGRPRYILFYLSSGIIATLSHLFVEQGSAIPLIGASGAIAGVLGAYMSLFFNARVTVIFPPFIFFRFDLPAWLVISEWFLVQFLNGMASLAGAGAESGTAFFAHIGGFLAGLLLVRLLLKPNLPKKPPPRSEQHPAPAFPTHYVAPSRRYRSPAPEHLRDHW